MDWVIAKIKDIYSSRAAFAVVVFVGTWILLPVSAFILVIILTWNACTPREKDPVCDGPAMLMYFAVSLAFSFGPVLGLTLASISVLLPRRGN
jgi:hypothetical protein